MSRTPGPLQPLFERVQPAGGMSVATQIIVINALATEVASLSLLAVGGVLLTPFGANLLVRVVEDGLPRHEHP